MPSPSDRVQQEIHRRAASLTAARASGASLWEKLRAAMGLDTFSRRVSEEVFLQTGDQDWSSLHDPFRWSSYGEWRRARSAAGLNTPALRNLDRRPKHWDRNPSRQPSEFWSRRRDRYPLSRSPGVRGGGERHPHD